MSDRLPARAGSRARSHGPWIRRTRETSGESLPISYIAYGCPASRRRPRLRPEFSLATAIYANWPHWPSHTLMSLIAPTRGKLRPGRRWCTVRTQLPTSSRSTSTGSSRNSWQSITARSRPTSRDCSTCFQTTRWRSGSCWSDTHAWRLPGAIADVSFPPPAARATCHRRSPRSSRRP